jgi:hypothetical protein
MRKKNRSFLLMSLISASLLVSVFTIVQAQSPAALAAKATNWSDPATWPNRKVPVAGDKVIIEKDTWYQQRRVPRRRRWIPWRWGRRTPLRLRCYAFAHGIKNQFRKAMQI